MDNVSNSKTVLTSEIELQETSTGNYWGPKYAYQDIIVASIKQGQIFDEEIYSISKKYIKPDTIVLDVGSNLGQMAVQFSLHVGKGMVYGFEANHFIYSLLKKNIEANNAPIRAFEYAVYDKSGEPLFFEDYDFNKYGSYGSFGIDYKNSKGTPVKTIALDDIDYPLPISFIKIDAQGSDLFVMQGARKIIEKYRMPILFEYEYLFEERNDMNFQQYVDFVQSIDYHFSRCILGQNHLILPNT